MAKAIDVDQAPARWREILEDVARGHITYVLERDGHPDAVLLPYEDYQRWQQSEDDVLRQFDETIDRLRARAAHISDEEVAADVAAAIDEVRRGEQ